jgi:hypothetical protein
MKKPAAMRFGSGRTQSQCQGGSYCKLVLTTFAAGFRGPLTILSKVALAATMSSFVFTPFRSLLLLLRDRYSGS